MDHCSEKKRLEASLEFAQSPSPRQARKRLVSDNFLLTKLLKTAETAEHWDTL